ncbi:MAG: glycosyltransferase family 2 protein [Patescibacteria group bacterium]
MESHKTQGALRSVVVPAHNESENLVVLIPLLTGALRAAGGRFELIIVNNASNDTTAQKVPEFQRTIPELRMVDEPVLGYGRAVLAGLRSARGDSIGIMRADNQEKPEDLCRMFADLTERNLSFYKAVRKHRMGDGLLRVVTSLFYNTLFRILFRLRSRDLNATPKVFTREFMDAAHLVSTDWFIDAEMVIKAEHMGYRVGETEIEYLPRLKGKSTVRVRHVFEFLRNMISWFFRIRNGKLLEQ